MDDNGHGTHVAGVIAAKANNGYGITGISYNSKILAIKVLTSQGWGTDYDIFLGIIAAANNAAVKVINMSLGGAYSATEEEAVNYAVNTKGKLLVASAGNDNTDIKTYPAGLADLPAYTGKVLAVAAHDITQCRGYDPGVWGSNYGTWVSISAPGVDILSTIPNRLGSQGFDSLDGTSMAAPHVSGAAALVWAKYPTYTNAQIAGLLTSLNAGSTDPLIRDDTCWPNDGSTFQRLNILHVLEQEFYELCDNKGGIWGFAFDAETGDPLGGAKATAKQGTLVTGADYVSYYGEINYPFVDLLYQEGYGIFHLLTLGGTNSLTLQKSKYATVTFDGIVVNPCFWTYAGNIPVPPVQKPYYWIVVTWNDGFGGGSGLYDNYLSVPAYGSWPGGWINYMVPGDVNTLPYAKLLWDSHNGPDQTAGNRRASSEAIRIKKLLPGTYTFVVDDYDNGADSTSWSVSGIKVYVYKYNVLVATFTPPVGSGRYWYVFDLTGSTITPLDTLSNF
jgi:hypothetical protein